MSIDHNRIKVSDLETNQPNKTLITNDIGQLEFSDLTSSLNFKTINGESIVGNGNILTDSFFESGSGSNSVVLKNKNNSLSTGPGAVALGYYSQASGQNSFTEGENTKALGYTAHAEGFNTSAIGSWSHAEGNTTKASGQGSHAQGIATEASGFASHAQGEETFAVGDQSFAGGIGSYANQECSFVYGVGSIANGKSTIVLGSNITGENDHTTYVDNFNIKRFSNNPTIGTLGLDANNNVTLISGTGLPDFKTVNGESIVGNGNIDLSNKQDISNQINVTLPAIIQDTWHGKTVKFTGTGTLSIPSSFINSGMCFEGITKIGTSLSWSITSPKTFEFGTPPTVGEKQIFTFMQNEGQHSIMILGL